MTASTRTVTLSRGMPSWAGTGIVTICMFTFCRRSALDTSESKDDAPFELLDNANARPHREHTKAEHDRQGVKDHHHVLQFHPGDRRRCAMVRAGWLSTRGPPIGKRRCPRSAALRDGAAQVADGSMGRWVRATGTTTTVPGSEQAGR